MTVRGIVILTALAAVGFDAIAVLVAAPTIQAGLGASNAEIQLVVVGFLLCCTLSLLAGVRLAARFARRRLLQVGLLVFVVASLECAIAQGSASLIGARLAQGIGAGLVLAQLAGGVDSGAGGGVDRRRAWAARMPVVFLAAALVLGPLVAGLVIQADLFGTSWRLLFALDAVLGVITVMPLSRLLPQARPESRPESRPDGDGAGEQGRALDIPGLVLLGVALFLLAVPLLGGRSTGWPPSAWLSLAGGVLALAGFVAVQRRLARTGVPLVPIELFADRPFAFGSGMLLACHLSLYSLVFVLSMGFQDGLGRSALGAALMLAPVGVAFGFGAWLAGRWVPRFGRLVPVAAGGLAVVGLGATVAVAAIRGRDLTAVALLPTLLVWGFGHGGLVASLGAMMSGVAPGRVGAAAGVLAAIHQVGAAGGIVLVGLLFFDALGPNKHGTTAPYANALAVAMVFSLVTAVLATALSLGVAVQRRAGRVRTAELS